MFYDYLLTRSTDYPPVDDSERYKMNTGRGRKC